MISMIDRDVCVMVYSEFFEEYPNRKKEVHRDIYYSTFNNLYSKKNRSLNRDLGLHTIRFFGNKNGNKNKLKDD